MGQDTELMNRRAKEWERNTQTIPLSGSRFSDVHLLFPCSFADKTETNSALIKETHRLKSHEELFRMNDSKQTACEFFLDKVRESNNSEMTGVHARNISRTFLGEFVFRISYDKSILEEVGMMYSSRHLSSEIGMISVIFPYSSIPASLLLTALCSSSLFVKIGKEEISFETWMERKHIEIQGNPKAVVFEYAEVSKTEIINCLACEYEPMAPITGRIFTEWSEENFAQYNVAKVHASDTCLFYEMAGEKQKLFDRLNQQAVELFFIELLLMQEAAVNLVCNKVYSYLNDNLGNGNRNANETLFELSKEASNAILFVDYKKLRYPTVRVSAKRIAQRFGIEEDMEKYYKCREVLEQMISIDTIENENIENRLMNQLLLLLTMLQVLPTLYQVTCSLLQQKVSLLTIGSGIIGSLGCIVLYCIYRVCYRRAQRKSRERLFGK